LCDTDFGVLVWILSGRRRDGCGMDKYMRLGGWWVGSGEDGCVMGMELLYCGSGRFVRKSGQVKATRRQPG
jgi:hypothetical protein